MLMLLFYDHLASLLAVFRVRAVGSGRLQLSTGWAEGAPRRLCW